MVLLCAFTCVWVALLVASVPPPPLARVSLSRSYQKIYTRIGGEEAAAAATKAEGRAEGKTDTAKGKK